MSKKWIVVAGMSVAAAVVLFAGGIVGGVLSGVIPAIAQEEPVEGPPFGTWGRHGMPMGWRADGTCGRWTTMFDAAAEVLGLTPDELFTELHAGKCLPEIAEEQGVETEALTDAMKATRGEVMREAIEQAVEDGTLSQEQANWLLEGLDQGFFPGGRGLGFGRGRGFGGHWGIPQEQ